MRVPDAVVVLEARAEAVHPLEAVLVLLPVVLAVEVREAVTVFVPVVVAVDVRDDVEVRVPDELPVEVLLEVEDSVDKNEMAGVHELNEVVVGLCDTKLVRVAKALLVLVRVAVAVRVGTRPGSAAQAIPTRVAMRILLIYILPVSEFKLVCGNGVYPPSSCHGVSYVYPPRDLPWDRDGHLRLGRTYRYPLRFPLFSRDPHRSCRVWVRCPLSPWIPYVHQTA